MRARLYCDESRRYWCDLQVFKTREAMRKRVSRRLMGEMRYGDLAAVSPLLTEYGPSGRRTGLVARMVLNREDVARLGAGLVAHECLHAAMRYLERLGIECVSTDCLDKTEREEMLAYAVQRLMVQVEEAMG